MHGTADPAIISQWKAVADAETEALLRSQYAELALLFADLAGRAKEWKQGFVGWNMGESKVANEWRADAVRGNVLRALELRFRAPVPADLAEAVRALTDLRELGRWFDASQTATSIKEFRNAVRPLATNPK